MAKPSKSPKNVSLPHEWNDWQCIAIIAGLVLFFFRDHLLGNAFLWEDFLYYSYPVRNFAATSLANGEFPHWNPYTFNGMPFFADIQTTVLYLPCLALTFFVRDGILSYYWLQLLIILHYVLAGVTMFYFTKSFGLKNLPSLFSGIAFTFSSFMILHAIHLQIITMVAWWPLILLLFRKALNEPRWHWVFLAALVLGHSILAGFPQLTLYFFFFLLIFFAFEMLTLFKGRKVFSRTAALMTTKAGIVVGLAITLTAIQLLPTTELSSVSQRAAITYEKSTEGQMSWSHVLTLVFPKFFGTAVPNDYQYWGPGVYWYYWEDCIYRGALPLLLGILSLFLWKKNKYVPFFWGISFFALLFAVGDNFFLHKLFYDFVPAFSTFRAPARMMVFMSLAFALLSAFSIQHLLYEEHGKAIASLRKALLLALGFGVALWIMIISGMLAGTFEFLEDKNILPLVTGEANVSLFFLLLSGTVLFGLFARGAWTRWMGVALVGVLFLDLFVFGGTQNKSNVNPAEYFKKAQSLMPLLKPQDTKELFRVNTRNANGMIMDRNQGMIDRLFMLEGYTPLALQWVYAPFTNGDRSHDLLNVKYKTVTNMEKRSLGLETRTTYMPRAFFVYNLHTVNGEEELKTYINSDAFDYRTTAVLEKAPGKQLPTVDDRPQWKADITEYHQNSILLKVETPRDGFLVLSEIYYKGWNAYVDGVQQEVFKADYNLRGVFIDKGQHTVEFRFEQESFRRGAMISLASLILCGAGIGLPLLRKKKTS